MKVCTACGGDPQPLAHFSFLPSAGRYHSWCKECVALYRFLRRRGTPIPSCEHCGRKKLHAVCALCGPEKECSKCGAPKPMAQFYPNAANPDGRDHLCRECRKEYSGFQRFRRRDIREEYEELRGLLHAEAHGIFVGGRVVYE